jgi:hypothetical protein
MVYNWNRLGEALSFRMKLQKHMNLEHEDRVKDYLTVAYDNVDPSNHRSHVCYPEIKEAMLWLRARGWRVGIFDWEGDKGKQMTCTSPDGKWYRSHYQY